jgi:tetratricopeptide (TPR) repeat protein
MVILDKVLIKWPDNKYVVPSAYLLRGVCKKRLEDYEGAIMDYTIAIELEPDNVFAYYNRSLAKYDMEDFEGACKDLHKAAELGDEDAAEMIEEYCSARTCGCKLNGIQ